MGLRQIGVGLRHLGVPAGVIEDRGVGELPRESLVLLLYLADEPFDHPPASCANRHTRHTLRHRLTARFHPQHLPEHGDGHLHLGPCRAPAW